MDTGDRVEGNGLYDASSPTGKYTRQIFSQQNIDIICSGNHELYKGNTTDREFLDLIPDYGSNYLASNIDITHPRSGERVPLAQRFRKFTTKNHGIRVTAFGFLYDFTGNDKNSFLQKVEDTIKEQWFQDAIKDRDVDIFVVAGHVGLRQSEFANLFSAIRAAQWDVPIMFFGGHTHIRDYVKYDDKAYGLESGRYMETIGFQSVSGLPSHKDEEKKLELRTASYVFARRYLDNNLFSFYSHTGLNESTFPTDIGQNVSSQITKAREALNLDEVFGCNPRVLWMSRVPYPHKDSIFSWLQSRVIPEKAIDDERKDYPRIILANTGAMRFDIFKGPFTRDTTFIVSPFTSGFRYIKNVPIDKADRLLKVINDGNNFLGQSYPLLRDRLLKPPDQINLTQDYLASNTRTNSFTYTQYQHTTDSEDPPLTPGYTTHDDAGDDGDDTIHSEISHYQIPNCIESRINISEDRNSHDRQKETVDVVFLDFIQPWILEALKMLGAEYDSKDIAPYAGGKGFTEMIAEWVLENWRCDRKKSSSVEETVDG